MYKPYRTPPVAVSPDVDVPQARISKIAVFILRFIARPYLFFFLGFGKTVLYKDHVLFDAFKRSLSGESRCIIAFRHQNGVEPQLLGWFFLFKLKSLAAKKGIRFARNPHALFVYGYEVVRWGGWPARLVMPKIGAMPIHHSKLDSNGMSMIYKAISQGDYPLALAPEGQVSYITDPIPRLETGAIRIGFQAARQLAEKNINSPVEILPLSVFFRYGRRGRAAMERLLKKIEKICGFNGKAEKLSLPLTERLKNCRDHILEVNENRYKIKADASLSFEERLQRVVFAALENAERMLGFNVDSSSSGSIEGDFFPRLYRVRQACWDKIFLPGIKNLGDFSRIQRSAMDLKAGEAWHISRHQELADFGWYFRCPLPTEETALHNKVEYVQNLWDFANRTMGGAFSGRVNIFPRKIIIQTAPPINLSSRLPDYKKDKKAAVAASMEELEKAYLDSINEINVVYP